MLGFRGHFLTKSQRYSTTFTALRARTPDLAAASPTSTSSTADTDDPNDIAAATWTPSP